MQLGRRKTTCSSRMAAIVAGDRPHRTRWATAIDAVFPIIEHRVAIDIEKPPHLQPTPRWRWD
jgi:hypothetical protein